MIKLCVFCCACCVCVSSCLIGSYIKLFVLFVECVCHVRFVCVFVERVCCFASSFVYNVVHYIVLFVCMSRLFRVLLLSVPLLFLIVCIGSYIELFGIAC